MVFSVTSDLKAERLARAAVDAAFRLHSELGPGKPIDITFDGVHFRGAFVADLLLDERLLIELKSVERTAPVHIKQVLTYLRLLDLPLGLLLNFGAATFREGVRRVVNQREP
jgi:iron complex transport system substrate-binding protein